VLQETDDSLLTAYRIANRDTTLAFARACARAKLRRFVFVSSIGVHGNATGARPI
jgi:nucleoside-diphosphate-sugar epimerase